MVTANKDSLTCSIFNQTMMASYELRKYEHSNDNASTIKDVSNLTADSYNHAVIIFRMNMIVQLFLKVKYKM